jgi:hypothetical protein
MSDTRITISGGSELDKTTNCLMVHCTGADGEDLSSLNVFGQLGITARPFPASDDGSSAEWITMPGSNLAHAARDTRCADVVGLLDVGDTAVHSTGPGHAARLFLKETSRQAVLMSKDTDGDDCFITLNGSENKIQLTIAGMGQEMSPEGINIMSPGGYLQIKQDGHIVLNGSQVQLGNTALGNMMTMPPANVVTANAWSVALKTALQAIQVAANAVAAAAAPTEPAGKVFAAAVVTALTPLLAITPPPFLVATNVVG